MNLRIAINGYGRIGRCVLRALYENAYTKNMKIVAINDLGDIKTNAHLTKYDSTHGTFNAEVRTEGNTLFINEDPIRFYSERDPKNIPWASEEIDVVFECTGLFTSREKAAAHLSAGAKKVIISAPGSADIDATIVYGVNHTQLKKEDTIISNASCTTNCLAPLAKTLAETVGIESGLMNTIHAYTNDQMLLDSNHSDLRRARSATQSMIPTKTGAAAAVGLVLPELKGKLDGFAIRVPVLNVSVVDFTCKTKRQTNLEELSTILKNAANTHLKGIMMINELPLVSIDFNHNPASSIVDLSEIKVQGDLVKILAWYDNEWGFSNRLLDVAQYWFQK